MPPLDTAMSLPNWMQPPEKHLIPRWIEPEGLAYHAIIGGLFAWAFMLHGDGLGWTMLWITAFGVMHEWTDGDFQKKNHGPWNGIIDVLAFLVVPFIWSLFS